MKSGNRLPRPAHCPADLWSLVWACWSLCPADRPVFAALHAKLAARAGNTYSCPDPDVSNVEYNTVPVEGGYGASGDQTNTMDGGVYDDPAEYVDGGCGTSGDQTSTMGSGVYDDPAEYADTRELVMGKFVVHNGRGGAPIYANMLDDDADA